MSPKGGLRDVAGPLGVFRAEVRRADDLQVFHVTISRTAERAKTPSAEGRRCFRKDTDRAERHRCVE